MRKLCPETSRFDAVERQIRRGKYGVWKICDFILTLHGVEPRHFRAQVPYLKTRICFSLLSLKFCRCYFDPLCKIREHFSDFQSLFLIYGRFQWPRGLRHGSENARLLGLWVRISPAAWMFVCCMCCVLSGRGLGVGLITHPEESYLLWCVKLGVTAKSRQRRPWPIGAVAPCKKH
jgi:hypothetical protein